MDKGGEGGNTLYNIQCAYYHKMHINNVIYGCRSRMCCALGGFYSLNFFLHFRFLVHVHIGM